MRILAAAVGSTVGMAMVMVGCGHQAQSAPVTSKPEQTVADAVNRVVAASVDPDPRVGAVFLSGSDLHACTGSVLHSTAGNLVLTAAHCLSPGAPARFAPGFAGKASADDLWTVDALYPVTMSVALASTPARSTRVTVVAYPAGVGGLPIGCQAGTGLSDGGYPELPCAGLVDGTSGGPWMSGSTVTGVIGGLHGGGCAENLSYSSPFDQHIAQLYTRAEAGGPGDEPPSAYDDEC